MTSARMMLVLKVLLKWCDAITALVTYSEDLTAQHRAKIKIILMELKEAVRDFEKDLE